YPEKIFVPEWVAVKEDGSRSEYPVNSIPAKGPVLDLGMDSIIAFSKAVKKAGTVVFNGPAGVFEEKNFATGTFELLKAAASVEFSVIGGGHTAAVAEKMGIETNFTHISTGGGACIEFLTGETLPAVDALERSKKRYG
ncbi:MAG TPA: phosphoglycerate kinase, partial [Methanoregulaceae archaeon]|nr:phosphoglycerate kinase [Methanoregulaceae archaeon]